MHVVVVRLCQDVVLREERRLRAELPRIAERKTVLSVESVGYLYRYEVRCHWVNLLSRPGAGESVRLVRVDVAHQPLHRQAGVYDHDAAHEVAVLLARASRISSAESPDSVRLWKILDWSASRRSRASCPKGRAVSPCASSLVSSFSIVAWQYWHMLMPF